MANTISVTYWDTEGDEVQADLAARWQVCPRCDGAGKHDHPAFAGGITASDVEEDPDFFEEYLSGRYDVSCTECKGRTTVLTLLDPLEYSEEDRVHVWAWRVVQEEMAACDRMQAAERRYGA